MPIDPNEAREFYGQGGQFTTIRKLLKPGESVNIKLLDLNKDNKSKYPIKGKDYSYLLSFEKDGATMRMSVNSKNLVQQLLSAMYPDGPTGQLRPCLAKISRRTERKSYESEAVITKVDELHGDTDAIKFE